MTYEELLREMEKQKDEMTVMERMMEYAKGNEVDHIPYMLCGADTAANMYGYTLLWKR